MRWSFKLAKLWGIDIYVHYTFVLLLIWIFLSRGAKNDWATSLISVFFTLIIFGVVTLHEYGHALTARHFGISTRDITLWPFGGVATLQSLPQTPRQEVLVALAGPAVNFVLALATYLFTDFVFIPHLAANFIPIVQIYGVETLYWFMWSNIVLMAFNLIPAFPMDGGRVLRGFLSKKYDFLTATDKAVSIGRTCAIIMAIYGAGYNHMLIVIAIFIWWSGSQELNQAIMLERMRRVKEGTASLADLFGLGLGTMGNVMSHILGMSGFNPNSQINFGAATTSSYDKERNTKEAPEYIISEGSVRHNQRPNFPGEGKIIDAEFISDGDDDSSKLSTPSANNDGLRIVDVK